MDSFKRTTVFIILIGAVLGQSIVRSPTGTTGTIGGRAEFVCEVEYGRHLPATTWAANNEIIYLYKDGVVNYPKGTNKYVVTVFNTIFTLEVRNLNYTDGGHYTCNVIGKEKSAALIVLGEPVITQETTNLIDGQVVIFTCEARFGGPRLDQISPDLHPQMKLFLNDVTFKAEYHFQNEFLIEKVHEILVDDSMDKWELKCAIGTTNSNQLTSSTTLNVQYPVCDITYTPQKHKYVFGSVITCLARGYPIPLFEWRNWEHPDMVIKGPLLYITDGMEGKNSWTCTARNSVGGRMYEDEITVEFEAVPNTDIKNLQYIAPSWLVICLIAVGCLAAGSLGYIAFQRFKGH